VAATTSVFFAGCLLGGETAELRACGPKLLAGFEVTALQGFEAALERAAARPQIALRGEAPLGSCRPWRARPGAPGIGVVTRSTAICTQVP